MGLPATAGCREQAPGHRSLCLLVQDINRSLGRAAASRALGGHVLVPSTVPELVAEGVGPATRQIGSGGSRPGSYLLGSLGCGALKLPQATPFLAFPSPLGPAPTLLHLLWTLVNKEAVERPLADRLWAQRHWGSVSRVDGIRVGHGSQSQVLGGEAK